ncbi:MAG: hypothetical protein CMJ70_21325 [Planctomycetaceae bacterium]|nr:hypothetical protein [Planctomycetaceae bacterium]HAA70786.1 hypothetical protein [Planctomycetaceae bacterium]|tara:strand:+ start:5824 stop:6381 length:558 start_codon:yes stop_codon:yes gene_type:complete
MRWYREPLLHFVFLGGLVFLYHEVRRPAPPPTELPIVITQDDVNQLRSRWETEQGQPLPVAQLSGLVQRMVHEEILFREAVKVGLAQTDPVMRRQLIASMESLLLEFAGQAEPSDQELRIFLERPGNGYPTAVREEDWDQLRPQLREDWLRASKQQALEEMITSYRRDYEVILPASLAPVLEVTP